MFYHDNTPYHSYIQKLLINESMIYCAYLDQILSIDNKQDTYYVLSLLEIAPKQISNILPLIYLVVLQSDNSRYY